MGTLPESFTTACLAPAPWGRGLVPEDVRHLAPWTLAQATLSRAQAFCDVDNVPSRRTLEKAGFPREGRHERFIVHPTFSHEPRPCFMDACSR